MVVIAQSGRAYCNRGAHAAVCAGCSIALQSLDLMEPEGYSHNLMYHVYRDGTGEIGVLA